MAEFAFTLNMKVVEICLVFPTIFNSKFLDLRTKSYGCFTKHHSVYLIGTRVVTVRPGHLVLVIL